MTITRTSSHFSGRNEKLSYICIDKSFNVDIIAPIKTS